jgi:putative ABC transport system substrate-binding protein
LVISPTSVQFLIKDFCKGCVISVIFEGKNILIEFRTTRGKSARRPDLAAELVRLKVDVVVTDTAGEVFAAKNASPTIPIVMRGVGYPIHGKK